jgi:sec-independent protein translocase protein TatB
VFDLDPAKLLVLGVLAVVILGPNRLPQAARTLGHFIGQLRTMSSSFQTEVRDALGEPGDAVMSALSEFRPGEVGRSVRRAVTAQITATPAARAGSSAEPTVNGSEGPVASAGMPATPDDPSLN